MACALTQGYTPKVCKTPSGVDAILLAEYANISSITFTSNVATAITMASSKKFFQYKLKPEVGDFKYNASSDEKNGAYGYKIEANLQTIGLDTTTQEELDLLLKNTLVAIVKMKSGDYWLLGHEYGLGVATDNFESGVAMSDFQGNKIQLTGSATVRMKKVDPTIIAGLL